MKVFQSLGSTRDIALATFFIWSFLVTQAICLRTQAVNKRNFLSTGWPKQLLRVNTRQKSGLKLRAPCLFFPHLTRHPRQTWFIELVGSTMGKLCLFKARPCLLCSQRRHKARKRAPDFISRAKCVGKKLICKFSSFFISLKKSRGQLLSALVNPFKLQMFEISCLPVCISRDEQF